jgi:hypothetical protein
MVVCLLRQSRVRAFLGRQACHEESMDQSYQDAPPRRRSHGCLWGCLGLVLIVLLVSGAVVGYSAWVLHKAFESDARLQTIMAIVHNDSRAETVLGRSIIFTKVDSHTFVRPKGAGKTAFYMLRLIGTNGTGVLKVNLDLSRGKTKVILMILTGSDGHPHTLVGKEPENPLQQSL